MKKKAAGMFITDGNSVLLLQRNESEKSWSLPGGHAEEGESSLQAARREVKEEIGKFPKMERFDTFVEKYPDYEWTTYMMDVRSKFGGIRLSDEHIDYMWMPFEEASDYKLHPKLVQQLGKYIFATKKYKDRAIDFKEFFKIRSFSNQLLD